MANEPPPEEFDWVRFRTDSNLLNPPTFSEKFIAKTKENPFVPIGAFATLLCLGLGLVSFRRGERKMSQMMMRGRILAQGFTVCALIVGLGMTAMKNQK